MKIEPNKVVSIDYKLTDAQGKLLDASQGRGPLFYLHGVGQIIPGLEKALEGKEPGDELNDALLAGEGYGQRNETLVHRVMRSRFGKATKIEPGMQFQANSPQGQTAVFTIVKIEGDEVTVDGNHPLAGVELRFEVKVAAVRDATEEELEHGHAHGPGGHHH